MGWDAFAETKTGKVVKSKVILEEFKKGFEVVREAVGCADGLLDVAALDCSGAGAALHKATGCHVYNEAGWPSEKVKELNEDADWENVEGCLSLIASAKKFLEICANNNLSIRFSW